MAALNHLAERIEIIHEITPRLRRLLFRSRERGVEVFHIRVGFRTRSTRDGKRGLLNRPQTALPDEIVLDKTSVSAFNSTSIDQVLRNMRRDRLWVTGVVTEGCVELTARDAADRGYHVTLVTDACASSRRTAHDDAVQRMTDGNVIRGRKVDELIAMTRAAERAEV